MSIAQQLASAPIAASRSRRGPAAACDIYGKGDLDLYDVVHDRRNRTSWSEAQASLDDILKVRSIHIDKFRYHFSGKCGHWTDEQRDEIRAKAAE